MSNAVMSVSEQILKAMDGRTQRWLSLRAMIPEAELSRKLNGKNEFTDNEIETIEKVLLVVIKK